MSEKVLVIDDDEDLAELLGLLMRKNGYETEVALTGRDAIEKARRFNPSVIIQDYMLPDMKGTDLLKTLRGNHPDSYVIIITARGSEDIAVELLKAGAVDYLKKPFETDKLLHTVSKVLQLRYSELHRGKLMEELAQQNTELMGLNAISAALTSNMSAEEKCSSSVSIIMNTMGADIVNVFTMGGGNRLALKFSMSRDGDDIKECRLDRFTGLSSYVAEIKKPAIVASFANETRFKVPPEVLERGLTSAIAVPMMAKDDIKGVLTFYTKAPRAFPAFDIKLMTSFANLFAMALESMLLQEANESTHKLWQSTCDVVPDKIIIVNPDHKIIYANKAAAEHISQDIGGLVGQQCCWMFHGTKAPVDGCPVASAFRTGETVVREFPMYGESKGNYHVAAHPIFGPEGKVELVVEYARKL